MIVVYNFVVEHTILFFCATENTHKLRDEVNRDINNEIQNILEQKTPHC